MGELPTNPTYGELNPMQGLQLGEQIGLDDARPLATTVREKILSMDNPIVEDHPLGELLHEIGSSSYGWVDNGTRFEVVCSQKDNTTTLRIGTSRSATADGNILHTTALEYEVVEPSQDQVKKGEPPEEPYFDGIALFVDASTGRPVDAPEGITPLPLLDLENDISEGANMNVMRTGHVDYAIPILDRCGPETQLM